MPAAIIKICGITDDAGLDASLDAGSDMIGLVFYEPSPRHVSFARATALASRMGSRACRVALTVDASDEMLVAIVEAATPDVIQLHGSETPERVAAVKTRFGLRVMRALSIGSPADLARIPAFDAVADLLLFDAPAPSAASRPGGNGAPFDWTLLRDLDIRARWLLAGGLTAANVAAALAATRADGVDVSSGVECAPGVKDAGKIDAFVAAARGSAHTFPAPRRLMAMP